ncbi:MAG: hypothetical protein KGD64_09270, partial [Candidatus Heimdallarchaeota archaeon]|nr:hypothetical protein [Candidatus Heimdallarchaeota archaeon]
REEINQAMHLGNLTVTDYPIPEVYSNYHNPDIVKYTYDLDKAFDWLTPGYNLSQPIPYLLETLLILGGVIIIMSAIPTYFITKGLFDYRKSKRKDSEISANDTDSTKDM